MTQFEGPEKKLEIMLFDPMPDLRTNADGKWNRITAASGADIISRVSTPETDAYLLSESSLFIWNDRILMITCGNTRLIDAIDEIMTIVHRENVALFFYERKNFMYPHSQQADFESDVAEILTHFPGKSYRLGPANYDHIHIFFSTHADMMDKTASKAAPNLPPDDDATLELMMHDLDPSGLGLFHAGGPLNVKQVAARTGLDRLYPDMIYDGYIFSPCGFSLNAISGETYFAVHVTPQESGSYASFETNRIDVNYSVILTRILSLFGPARFSFALTWFAGNKNLAPGLTTEPERVSGYRPTERSLYEFDSGYAVKFLNYVRTEH
jgi:S-adenosylmethionine decarboxylase